MSNKETKRVTATVLKEDLDKIMTQEKTNQTTVFNLLMDMYNYCPTLQSFSKDEQDLIKRVINKGNGPRLKRKIKLAIIKAAKAEENNPSTGDDEEKINPALKNSARSAELRVDTIVKEIMQNNDKALHWHDKRLITAGSIESLATEHKKANPEYFIPSKIVIRKYFEIHKAAIEEHNKAHNLASDHNIKAHAERKRLQKAQGGQDANNA